MKGDHNQSEKQIVRFRTSVTQPFRKYRKYTWAPSIHIKISRTVFVKNGLLNSNNRTNRILKNRNISNIDKRVILAINGLIISNMICLRTDATYDVITVTQENSCTSCIPFFACVYYHSAWCSKLLPGANAHDQLMNIDCIGTLFATNHGRRHVLLFGRGTSQDHTFRFSSTHNLTGNNQKYGNDDTSKVPSWKVPDS